MNWLGVLNALKDINSLQATSTLIRFGFLLARPDGTESGLHDNRRRWFGRRYALQLYLGQSMKAADNTEDVEAHVPVCSQTHRSHSQAQVLPPREGTALCPRAFALTFLGNLFASVLFSDESLKCLGNGSWHAEWGTI